MFVISSEKRPIKIWAKQDELEPQALVQLKNTANLPFVFKHVAVMPDVHLGYGATIGSVFATKGAVCPAAVGVDIGCGMMAVKTPLDYRVVQDVLPKIRYAIERVIPLGPGGITNNNKQHDSVLHWGGWSTLNDLELVDDDLFNRAYGQMGSLGSGNHFIEICLDTDKNVWVMLHSGSRGVGNILARRFINSAKKFMNQIFVELVDNDLAYLVEGSNQYDTYMLALNWCQEYAFENRKEMMRRVLREVADYCTGGKPIDRIEEINCHHNYAETENHFGQNVLVTRKGAVRARKGDLGIIPGSMGTRSYIVRGLGNKMSFNSCSHGAGRAMSRTEARRRFTVEDLERQTKGVECRKDKSVLDELPSAYKDIDAVMDNQKDLVEIVAELKQILCVKGG